MKKIYNFFQKINTWLASFGADRYLHLVAGILISFFVSMGFQAWQQETLLISTVVGYIITVAIGLGKEVLDQNYTGKSDITDWLFTGIGGLIGAALFAL